MRTYTLLGGHLLAYHRLIFFPQYSISLEQSLMPPAEGSVVNTHDMVSKDSCSSKFELPFHLFCGTDLIKSLEQQYTVVTPGPFPEICLPLFCENTMSSLQTGVPKYIGSSVGRRVRI